MNLPPLTKQIRSNAVSAYFLLFVSGLFLFNKTNPALSHPFVQQHTKNALLIHILFLVAYSICILSNVFSGNIFWIELSRILFIGVALLLLSRLLYGIYMAHNGKLTWSAELLSSESSTPQKNIIFHQNMTQSEREKMDIVLSYIPFIGFLRAPKNTLELHNQTIAICISGLILFLLYVEVSNFASILTLLYTIYVVFQSVQLFWMRQVYEVQWTLMTHIYYAPLLIKTLVRYIYQYISGAENIDFSKLQKNITTQDKALKTKKEAVLKTKADISLPKYLIYIPFINSIFVLKRDSRYMHHIYNGLTITIVLIVIMIGSILGYISFNLILILLYPICFWISGLKKSLAYHVYGITDIWLCFQKIIHAWNQWKWKINTIRKTETHTTFGSDKNS